MGALEIKLINTIKQFPFLYEMKHPQYNDNRSKALAWLKISSDLNESVERVKTRWRTLRNSYRIELIRIDAEKPTKWKYYNKMTFLSGNMRIKGNRLLRKCRTNKNSKSSVKSDVCNKTDLEAVIIADQEIIDLDTCDTESLSSIKLESGLTEAPLIPPNTHSCVNYGSELKTFMEAMTEKITNENLNRDQMDELQEQMLVLLNRKLRDFRQM